MRVILLFIFLGTLSCEKTSNFTAPEIAFYHWKNEINLSKPESKYLQKLAVQKLYLRFFDVDWNAEQKQPVPISVVKISSLSTLPSIIIPTIYITNRTFLKIKNKDILSFAEDVISKIKTIRKEIPNAIISEVQIDCDWTQKSKENYFYFLALLKKALKKENKTLSVTIRLHQLKFPEKTGVPPVHRGALICYNVGDLQKWDTENSILDEKITANYLKRNMDYPLPLDLALPVFQWGVLFRDGELIKLVNQLNLSELSDQNFYTKENNNRFSVNQSTYLRGHYLYPGDQIRLESVSPSTLVTVSKQIKHAIPSNIQTLIFYHIDSLTVTNFPVEEIKKIQRTFGEVK